MVWGFLGMTDQAAIKKTFGRAHVSLQVQQTIMFEVELILNNRPFMRPRAIILAAWENVDQLTS